MTDQNTTAHLYARDGFGRITGDIIGNFGAGVDTTVARIGRVFEPRGMLQEITSYSDSAGATPVNDVYRLFNDFAQMTDEYQMHTQMAVDSGAADAPYIHYDYSGGSGNTIRGTDEQYFFNLSGTRTIAFGYSGPDDSLSRISSLTSTGGGTAASGTVSQLTYLGLDAIVTENYPQPDVNLDYTGGTAANYSGLDNFDRVAMQLWTQPSSLSTFDQFNYTYALAGNRTTRGNAVAAAYMRYLDEQYSYDHLYRVNVANRGQLSSSGTIAAPLHKENWTLDATGNWNTYSNSSSWASLSQTRSFNRANQITAISGSGSAPTAYDNNGNMTQLPFVPTGSSAAVNGSGTYDAWNRLMSTTGGTACTFAYDGLTRRIQKIVGGATTDYYLDGQRVAESDYTPSGGSESLQYQFVWSPRYIDAPILRDDFTPGTTFARLYYLDDANFNVTTVMGFALTSGDWEPLERYVYDAYGKPIFFNGDWTIWRAMSAVKNMTLFTGRELDPENGLYYYRARYYSSRLGCFVSRDSIEYHADVNVYRYVFNSTLTRVDPFGLDTFCDRATQAGGRVSFTRAEFEQLFLQVVGRRPTAGQKVQLDRGCVGIAALKTKSGVGVMPEDTPGTKCYRTEPEAAARNCDAGKCAVIFMKQGKWRNGKPGPGTGEILNKSITGTGGPGSNIYNYVTKIHGCYWWMTFGTDYATPTKPQMVRVAPTPPHLADYPDEMWCATCRTCTGL